MVAKHLGGHGNITHIDTAVLQYFLNQGADSFLDIGCGPGGMVKEAKQLGFNLVIGVDGDPSVCPIILHDYSTGPLQLDTNVDIVWSCEFVEHVEEKYLPNFMETFKSGKLVCMTFAPPGKKGHHHVNLQVEKYWIDTFEKYGFKYLPKETMDIRAISSMKREFVRDFGLVFRRQDG